MTDLTQFMNEINNFDRPQQLELLFEEDKISQYGGKSSQCH